MFSSFKLRIKNNYLPLEIEYSNDVVLQTLVGSVKFNNTFADVPLLQIHNNCPERYRGPFTKKDKLPNHIARRFINKGVLFLAGIDIQYDMGQVIHDVSDLKNIFI